MIVGQWTIAELKDLIADKDDEMRALKNGLAAFGPTWGVKDKDAYVAWLKDYSALCSRYARARKNGDLTIQAARLSPLSDDMQPANDAYVAILRALQKVEGTRTPGDKLDLMIRMTDAGGKLEFHPPPQTAKDWDLLVFKAGGKVLEQVDPGLVGKPGLSNLEKGAIGVGLVGVLYMVYRIAK